MNFRGQSRETENNDQYIYQTIHQVQKCMHKMLIAMLFVDVRYRK